MNQDPYWSTVRRLVICVGCFMMGLAMGERTVLKTLQPNIDNLLAANKELLAQHARLKVLCQQLKEADKKLQDADELLKVTDDQLKRHCGGPQLHIPPTPEEHRQISAAVLQVAVDSILESRNKYAQMWLELWAFIRGTPACLDRFGGTEHNSAKDMHAGTERKS